MTGLTVEDIKDELVDMIMEAAAEGNGKRLGVLKYAYTAVNRQQEYSRYSYRQTNERGELLCGNCGGSLDENNCYCPECGAKLLGTFDD